VDRKQHSQQQHSERQEAAAAAEVAAGAAAAAKVRAQEAVAWEWTLLALQQALRKFQWLNGRGSVVLLEQHHHSSGTSCCLPGHVCCEVNLLRHSSAQHAEQLQLASRNYGTSEK
jgi:hypothetical protein